MSVQIGNLSFDRVHYDRDADVLYLHRADPRSAVDFDESPEGHALRYNAAGELIGVTIVNARWLLEQDGKVTVTIPERFEVGAAALDEALAAA